MEEGDTVTGNESAPYLRDERMRILVDFCIGKLDNPGKKEIQLN